MKIKEYENYKTYKAMKGRCYNVNNNRYDCYGGRGITMCDQWLSSFLVFDAYMGPRPSKDHSIDRIDNDGNYEPGNCRWATRKEQNRNTRSNHVIEYLGQKRCLAEWVEITGLSRGAIEHRIRKGLSIENVLCEPACKRIEYNGKSLTVNEWALEIGISRKTLFSRIYTQKWSIEKALTKPKMQAKQPITFDGKTLQLSEWAIELGIDKGVLRGRLYSYGWSIERAFTTPAKKYITHVKLDMWLANQG